MAQLKREALKYGLLGLPEDRDKIIDAIMTHLERNDSLLEPRQPSQDQAASAMFNAENITPTTTNITEQTLMQFMITLTTQIQNQQQQIMVQFRETLQQLA